MPLHNRCTLYEKVSTVHDVTPIQIQQITQQRCILYATPTDISIYTNWPIPMHTGRIHCTNRCTLYEKVNIVQNVVPIQRQQTTQ